MDASSISRRSALSGGGLGLRGVTMPKLLQATEAVGTRPAHAKSVIFLYQFGGPSHLDLWDPKTDVPDNVRSVFKPIDTKLPGVQFTELMPKLAQEIDKTTLLRAVSYTPNGLFNHTAAIYQMMTGYTTDKVSPSGQLEPPNPPNAPSLLRRGCRSDGLPPAA